MNNKSTRSETRRHRRAVVILLGPTAVGKTAVSLELARRLPAEILCADSMQVYRGMDIGTAKPTPAEQAAIPHHGIDLVSPEEPFSVAKYLAFARTVIDPMLAAGRLPLVVGGTGLYLRALTEGLVRAPSVGRDTRRRLEDAARQRGTGPLHRRLEKVDPVLARNIHPSDAKRILRALGVYEEHGIALSVLQRSTTRSPGYRACKIGLTRSRETLYRRIDERVDRMLDAGLVEEVRTILTPRASRTARQALGYKEMADFFSEKIELEEALRRIRTRTRRYAKRQLTWFRKDPGITWFDIDPADTTRSLAGRVLEHLRSACNLGV